MFPNIQILRGIAATMVVLFHVVLWLPLPQHVQPPLIYEIFKRCGEVGVDLFFVVSGFVIMWSQTHNPRPADTFLYNRVLRILPLYWIMTLLFAAIVILAPQLAANQPPLSVGKLLRSLGMVNTLTTGELPVVFVGWTLEYEMLFYVSFAICSAILPLKAIPFVLTPLLGLMAALGYVEARVLLFAFGMFVAKLRIMRPTLPFAMPLLVVGILVFLASLRWPHEQLRMLLWGLPSVMIVTSLIYLPQLKTRAGNYFGDASYAIYLGQTLAIPAAIKLINLLMNGANFTIKTILVTLASVIFGCLLHSVVEKPVTRLLKRAGRQAPTVHTA